MLCGRKIFNNDAAAYLEFVWAASPPQLGINVKRETKEKPDFIQNLPKGLKYLNKPDSDAAKKGKKREKKWIKTSQTPANKVT